MTDFKKRFLCLVLCLCLTLPVLSVYAEDSELDVEEVIEDVLLDEDGNEYYIDEETGETYVIGESAGQSFEELDETRDDTVNPDSLELNPNLPGNIVNILLVGVDTRTNKAAEVEGRGDTQIIVSVDTEAGTLKLTSILRDSYVTIPGYVNKQKINVAFQRGGGALAMRTVNHNFEMNIQYYVAINFNGLATIIDALGGIDIELTKAEAKYINSYLRKHPPAYDNKAKGERVALQAKAGTQHLDGVQAVMYARIRSLTGENDFNRTDRQRHLLDLLLQLVLQDISVDKLIDLLDACVSNATTNMTMMDIFNLAMAMLQSDFVSRLGTSNTLIEQLRLPIAKGYTYGTTSGGSSVIKMNMKKNVSALHEFIYGQYIPAD